MNKKLDVQEMPRKIAVIITTFTTQAWDIEGYPNYFFGSDKKLYRFDSRGRVKQNKRLVIGSTQGYILKSRFFSLSQLRPLLRRHDDTTDYPTAF